jgi:aspartate racemase
MTTSRSLGLLGGVGVGAASHYYREIAKACEARGVELDLVMVHADMQRVIKYVQAGDRAGHAVYLKSFLDRMKAAGAELAAIPSVTTHYSVRELIPMAPLPIVDMFGPVAAEVARCSIRRVAVFGTRFVIQSDMFGFVPGVEFVLPLPDEIDTIHATYLQLATDGRGTEEQYRGLRELAHSLIERERLDAIVFGGTDLALLFNESNIDFPNLDCAALHVRAIVDAMLGNAAQA